MKKSVLDKLIRCPKLGDEMTLAYCLKESGSAPCLRIIQCWSPFFNIESLLKRFLKPEDLNKLINGRQKDKVASLIELIKAAKVKP